ncbi:MAG: VWA domain-containing protein [Treponema sp.]|jgi:Ca-activated chloride channel family protein|nr:VWA domain-containing protein [Treponema sp.]
MTFEHPAALLAFAVFIPVIAFDIISFARNRKKAQVHGTSLPADEKYAVSLIPPQLAKKLKLSIIFFRLFICFSIIAIAGPMWGFVNTENEYRRGLDIVYAIDVSRSMDIRDAQTGSQSGLDRLRSAQLPGHSRLERGLLIARLSAREIQGARIAAAIGRGRGLLAVPLTWDSEAALGFMEALDGSSMTGRSTNLEALVNAAADAFISSSPARRVIVLVSDGESHSGTLASAVNRCVKENIVINAVALGSDEGSPLQDDEAFRQGSLTISKRDAAVMRMAAERTGGVYIDGSLDDAASVLSAHLLSLASHMQEPQPGPAAAPTSGAHDLKNANVKKEAKERRSFFIILAVIAYGISKIVTRIMQRSSPHIMQRSSQRIMQRSSQHNAQRLSSATMIMLSALFFSSCSEGKLLLMEANYLSSQGRYNEAVVPYLKALEYEDAAPYAEYGLGLTFYLQDEGIAALKHFGNSKKMTDNIKKSEYREHRELRYRTSYNSGIVYFEEGDFNSAAAAFKDALRADPEKTEAKKNLELSLMSIAREETRKKRGEQRKESESKDILFEYLKQEEQQKWKSREWSAEEEFTGADY